MRVGLGGGVDLFQKLFGTYSWKKATKYLLADLNEIRNKRGNKKPAKALQKHGSGVCKSNHFNEILPNWK